MSALPKPFVAFKLLNSSMSGYQIYGLRAKTGPLCELNLARLMNFQKNIYKLTTSMI